jgi:hypothetical protein
MVRFSCFVLLAILAVLAAYAAPPKPNFTGTWNVNFQKSVLEIPAPDTTIFVVEHNEPSFRLTRTHVAKGTSDTFSIDLTTDGKEVIRKDGNRTDYSRAYWEGDVLVFATRIVMGDKEATNLVRYAMAKDSQSFTAMERFRSPKLRYDNVWVMEPQK